MPRQYDGNEPHFIPKPVSQTDSVIVSGPDDDLSVYSPYNLDEICEKGFSQKTMTRLIVGTLKTHFSSESNIVDPIIKPYIWSNNPDETKIRIATASKWDSHLAGNAPSIIVSRGDMQTRAIAMGDYGAYDTIAAAQEYVRHAAGSFLVHISAQGDGFIEVLADEVFDMLNAQLTFLRERWPIHKLEVAALSGAKSVEGHADHLLHIQIAIGYEYEYGWARCDDPNQVLRYRATVNAEEAT